MDALKTRLESGILAFPATPFTPTGALDLEGMKRHATDLAHYKPSALIAAGGAGELFSLNLEEHRKIIRITVAASGNVPVFAGVGHGIALAKQQALAAEAEGAVGLLVFPPYLVRSEQAGLAAYIREICSTTSLAVMVYSRDNAILAPDTVVELANSCPTLIALKDGTGDFEALSAMKAQTAGRLVLVNGVPTAEIIARQCFSMGITSYSSAIFTFYPELALAFHTSLVSANWPEVERITNDFILPLTNIRNRGRGFAVSLVKAGLDIMGRSAGPLRAPLIELSPDDKDELATLVARFKGIEQ